ncbi:PAS domain S-box protein [Ramlibacter sp. WS9]|uniref:hybrid sensor histidine kinase/response regulator n=1 Tax=Ramlibacter sp. WS9 TaxID=1882741 RepID=UPI001141B535|nr:PAS domain S-box protein [Ramlibacter sp. WS9]
MQAQKSRPANASAEHYRQVVESAVDYAIVGTDLEGHITIWNEGACRVLGWGREEMLGEAVHRFFTPEDVAAGRVEYEMETARLEGRASDERWHVRKSGERFWASGELMPVCDGPGEVTGFVKIIRDRTEQRMHEAHLQELNAVLAAGEVQLQLAMETGGMAVWQSNLKTHEMTWWPGMHALHGLEPGTPPLSMGDYYQVIIPEDRDEVAQVLRGTPKREGEQGVEYRVLWPDGTVHWLEGRGRALLDAKGEPWAVAGVCMDVTARKNTEADLKFLADASAELAGLADYQATLDKVAHLAVPHFADWCAVDMLDETGAMQRVAVAHVDPEREQLARELHRHFPHDPAKIAGVGPWNVVHTGEPERLAEIPDEMLAASVTNPDYLAALRALGLHSYMGLPLTVRGKTLGVICFATAESPRRYTAQDQALAADLARRAAVAIENATLLRTLRESDRAKDVFLATLAHELRNPLAPVWNGLSIIRRIPTDAPRVVQIADMIERQVAQLTRLVDDLLDVSRISTGKIELRRQPTNLVSIISSAIETSRPHIEACQHRLSVSFPDEPTDLEADPLRLAQVFSNLLNNAARYTRPGGNIDVIMQAAPDHFTVRVRDNGAGIPRDMLVKIFALFTQVTHPAQRHHGGLGIGLSLVEGLVRLHGGRVEAHSEGLGKGSEFVVWLPRTPQAASDAKPEDDTTWPVPAGQSARRILVVDDNRDAAETLAELLRMLGNEVALSRDGLGALARVPVFRPDVVLLDIGLPDISGYEVARRVRGLTGVRQPWLVALTGWGQHEDKQRAAEAGFDDHWTKPVDPARLQELSRNLRR